MRPCGLTKNGTEKALPVNRTVSILADRILIISGNVVLTGVSDEDRSPQSLTPSAITQIREIFLRYVPDGTIVDLPID